jgi:hypothetical protein
MDNLIKGIPDWHQIINDNFINLDTRVTENHDKLGDLTQNGLTESDLATAIKNDRTQLSQKVNQSDLNIINSNVSNKADISYVNNSISQIQSGVKGTYTNLVDLQTAFPSGDSGNYVVASNGHVYTWKNSAWTDTNIQYLSAGIADKSVSPYQTTFANEPNIFDRTTSTSSKFVLGTDGTLTTNVSYYASDYIPIESNTWYSKTFSNHFAFYDINKNYISGYTTNGINPFQTPSNASYIRVSVPSTDLMTFMLQKGKYNSSYYIGYGTSPKILQSSVDLPSGIVQPKHVSFMNYSFNIFDKKNITLSKYVLGTDGTLVDNSNYVSSDYIQIKPNTYYTKSNSNHFAFYDSNKNYISGYTTNGMQTFITPSNAYYVRISILVTDLPTFMLNEGKTLLSYAAYMPYGKLYKECILTNWFDKIMSTIGDSITNFGTWQPYICSALGMTYNNCGIGGSRVSDTDSNRTDAMCTDNRINAIPLNSDLVVFMGGTNDWANNVPIGDKTYNNIDITTFVGALNVMFRKMITRFPQKKYLH